MILLYKILAILLIFFVMEINTNEFNASSTSPNIIIIMADDMGIDDVSFRGANEFLTPNIDALAYHGRILDRLYAPSMCTPSRGALLTGRYPIHTGTQHFVISNEEPWSLPTNVTTIAQVFQNAGYSTNLVGKWHLGFARREFTPTQRGFDYHYGYWGSYIDYYKRNAKMPVANYTLGYDFRRNMELACDKPGVYMTDLLTEEAERIIDESAAQRKPLFLMLNHLAAHTANEHEPLQAPEDVIARFAYIKDPNRRKYAAMITKLDESVGRIVYALSRAKMLENSIIIFYADNGAPSVDQFSNTGKNYPLRGQKNTPWEGGVRVAAAIWSNLLQARGSIFQQPIYVADWLPTLAHAANIMLPKELQSSLDGIDLWPQLMQQQQNDNTSAIVEREILHNLDDIWHVISYMHGRFKYINGSTANGRYDKLLTYRETEDLDPRVARYVVEVRNSMTSKALRGFDQQRLTRHRIESLRAAATIRCSDATPNRNCNTLIEECLYDVIADPCERNNLLHVTEYSTILHKMRKRINDFRSTAWPVGNRKGHSEYDPTRHDCTWTNFLEETASKTPHVCNYDDLACAAAASRV